MPCSCSTSATRRDERVGVLAPCSRVRTDSSVRSGHDAAEQLHVLDLPGHHRLRDAGVLQNVLMHLPSWPSEIQWRSAAELARASVFELRKRLVLDRDDGDVVAERRAARSTRKGNRPLPAIRPMRRSDRVGRRAPTRHDLPSRVHDWSVLDDFLDATARPRRPTPRLRRCG